MINVKYYAVTPSVVILFVRVFPFVVVNNRDVRLFFFIYFHIDPVTENKNANFDITRRVRMLRRHSRAFVLRVVKLYSPPIGRIRTYPICSSYIIRIEAPKFTRNPSSAGSRVVNLIDS